MSYALKFTDANVRECEEKLKRKFANKPKKKRGK